LIHVFAYEYFISLGRVTSPSAKPPFLGDQFLALSLASLLQPVRLGRSYQQHKVPAGIARNVIEARKLPHHDKVETFGGVLKLEKNLLVPDTYLNPTGTSESVLFVSLS
jgi:hypothetical protein